MAATLSQNALRWTLTPIILAAFTATAAAGSFTRGCAARDMQVLMLIEERENTRRSPRIKCAKPCTNCCTRGSFATKDMFSMPWRSTTRFPMASHPPPRCSAECSRPKSNSSRPSAPPYTITKKRGRTSAWALNGHPARLTVRHGFKAKDICPLRAFRPDPTASWQLRLLPLVRWSSALSPARGRSRNR